MLEYHYETEEDKYCVFLILGMLEIKIKVLEEVYINSYFTYDEKIIIVTKSDPDFLFKHKHYLADFDIEQGFLFLFDVPLKYKDDYLKFVRGDYSKLSKKIIDNMSEYVGLHIPKQESKSLFSHPFAYIISKHPVYKEDLELYFNISIPKKNELAEPPKNFNFSTIQNFFKEELEEQ